ncbi:discoidin domain-containing protein [Thalassotalea hakodatensis]|uniref:discoidin domain-containing protein n=1 Tax=Thalassotalea hakodatensis TaxID=3030492 RepID=UPI002572B320|nr:discoidin domain-containing protein [Thalassotalea hakodatensis]
MKKIALLSLFCLPLFTQADVVEYKGKVTDILIGKSQLIKVGVEESDEQSITCWKQESDQPWLFTFERGYDYSNDWFDVLNLVRRTQETIRIGYAENEDSECAIEYIALLKGDGIVDDGQVGDSLERTGQYGNIAQIYTNGLTESSYHASDNYGADVPAAAFDGHIFNEQIVDGEGSLINRGIWLVKKDTENKETTYWLQVEYEEPVTISGFRVMLNTKATELGRGPRHVTILTSLEGDQFEEQGQYNLGKSIDQRANLPTKVEAKIFRIQVNSNQGDAFIEIDELEVYSN